MYFLYENGGISADITTLELLSIAPDSISLGEQSQVVAFLSGDVDGVDTMDVAKGWIAENESIWSEWLK